MCLEVEIEVGAEVEVVGELVQWEIRERNMSVSKGADGCRGGANNWYDHIAFLLQFVSSVLSIVTIDKIHR